METPQPPRQIHFQIGGVAPQFPRIDAYVCAFVWVCQLHWRLSRKLLSFVYLIYRLTQRERVVYRFTERERRMQSDTDRDVYKVTQTETYMYTKKRESARRLRLREVTKTDQRTDGQRGGLFLHIPLLHLHRLECACVWYTRTESVDGQLANSNWTDKGSRWSLYTKVKKYEDDKENEDDG